jgi:hypothetical protein
MSEVSIVAGPKPGRRRVDNIKMDLREIGYGGMKLNDVAQDRDKWRADVKAAMNFRLP